MTTDNTTQTPSNSHSYTADPCQPLTWLDRKFRGILLGRLSGMNEGHIAITDHDGTHILGDPQDDELVARMTVGCPSLYRRVLFSGSLGAAESFVQGEWTTSDLTTVLRFFARNINALTLAEPRWSNLGKLVSSISAKLRKNTVRGSQQNIADHYDLSNTFFELFLDKTMMYSSAVFESPSATLEEASLAKLNGIGDRLELEPDDHVLEIGTGWGGFAEHVATRHGCQVTTTTISREQYEFASERIVRANLSDSVTLLQQDYRELSGTFDKLVSIEMLEAVGYEFLDTFFGQCDRLCKRGSRFFLQTIVMPEQRSRSYRKSIDFIQKYIFPGGFLPSLTDIQNSIGRATDFRLLHVRDHSTSYARTLEEWRARFMQRLDDVRQLGFSEEFIRTWNYYFSYCEAAFRERAIGIVQLEWVKVGGDQS